jgi:hypothetical protein
MTPTEAVKLTGYIQAHFPSQPINEFTPDALWELLADYPAEDCRKAVLALASGRVQWCAPSDVCAEVKRMRTKRLAQAGDLCPPPGLSGGEEREWLREARRQIANGSEIAIDHGELKPRHLPDLKALMPRVEPVSQAAVDPDHAANKEAARAELDALRARLEAERMAAIPADQRDPGIERVRQQLAKESSA